MSYIEVERTFALPHQTYPELEKTKKNIKIASQLLYLYVDVIITINEWKLMPRASVSTNLNEMSSLMKSYEGRCNKLPGHLRQFDSYSQLKNEIEDFQLVLPLLQELSKPLIKAQHWEEVIKFCRLLC